MASFRDVAGGVSRVIFGLAAIDAVLGVATGGKSLLDAFGDSRREITPLVLALVLQAAGLMYLFGRRSTGHMLLLVVLYIPFRDAFLAIIVKDLWRR
jgi:hypothetical protein